MPPRRSAAHASNVFVGFDQFRLTRGETPREGLRPAGRRTLRHELLRICGSDVPRHSPKDRPHEHPGGCLDTDPRIRPGYHIFVGSKAPWYDITDALPQYETLAS